MVKDRVRRISSISLSVWLTFVIRDVTISTGRRIISPPFPTCTRRERDEKVLG
jgi:hypothetical protein